MASAAARAGARLDGFLVEETAPEGHDIVIGGVRDPSFGQTVMFGLGGIFVEVLRDVSFRICPILPVDAREMIAELRGAPILSGARGGVRVDESRLEDLLVRVGGPKGLLDELADDLAEVDLNPIIVSASGAVAVDARFVLAERQP
jgi:acetyl-CoA synthetase (ADP-forming)